ncbi:zinc finger, C3HC4 type (RING finger) domain-containing protein, partial [Toxoplasma gondii FOU]
NCAICIEDFVPTALVRLLPCGHVFHRTCIDSWFTRSTLCPLCLHDYRPASPSPSAAPLSSSLLASPSRSRQSLLTLRASFPYSASSPPAWSRHHTAPLHSLLHPTAPSFLPAQSLPAPHAVRHGRLEQARTLQLLALSQRESARGGDRGRRQEARLSRAASGGGRGPRRPHSSRGRARTAQNSGATHL